MPAAEEAPGESAAQAAAEAEASGAAEAEAEGRRRYLRFLRFFAPRAPPQAG